MRLRVTFIALGLLLGLNLAGCAENSDLTLPATPGNLATPSEKIMFDPIVLADICKSAGSIDWDTIRGTISRDHGGVIEGQPESWPTRCTVAIQVEGNSLGGGNSNLVDIAVRVPSYNSNVNVAMYELDIPSDISYSSVTLHLPYLPWLPFDQDMTTVGLNCGALISNEIPSMVDDQMCALPVFVVDLGNIYAGDDYGKIIIDDPPGGD